MVFPIHSQSTKIFDQQSLVSSGAGTGVATGLNYPWAPTGIAPTGVYYSAPFDAAAYNIISLSVLVSGAVPTGVFSIQQTNECADPASVNGQGLFPPGFGGFPGFNGGLGVMGGYRQPGVNKSGGLCWVNVPSAIILANGVNVTSPSSPVQTMVATGVLNIQIGAQGNLFGDKWIRGVYTVASGSIATGVIDCWLQAKG